MEEKTCQWREQGKRQGGLKAEQTQQLSKVAKVKRCKEDRRKDWNLRNGIKRNRRAVQGALSKVISDPFCIGIFCIAVSPGTPIKSWNKCKVGKMHPCFFRQYGSREGRKWEITWKRSCINRINSLDKGWYFESSLRGLCLQVFPDTKGRD